MQKYFSAFLLLNILITASCSESDKGDQILKIGYGTSFGECIGYCKRSLSLEDGQVSYRLSAWVDSLETKSCSESLSPQSWESLQQMTDIPAFFNFSETIGCPDCADGGAEWAEIELSDGQKHKVTFEYRNEPQAIQELINELRAVMADFDHCAEL